MQTQYKAYTLGEALCSTLNLVILTINFDFNTHYQITPWSHQCTSYFQSILNREIPVTLSCKGGLPVQVIVIYLYW